MLFPLAFFSIWAFNEKKQLKQAALDLSGGAAPWLTAELGLNCVSMSLWGQLSILSLPLESDTALMGTVPAGSKRSPEFSSSFLGNQQLFVLSVRELQSLSWLVLEPSEILAQ